MQKFESKSEECRRAIMELHNVAQEMASDLQRLEQVLKSKDQRIVELEKQVLILKQEVKR